MRLSLGKCTVKARDRAARKSTQATLSLGSWHKIIILVIKDNKKTLAITYLGMNTSLYHFQCIHLNIHSMFHFYHIHVFGIEWLTHHTCEWQDICKDQLKEIFMKMSQ